MLKGMVEALSHALGFNSNGCIADDDSMESWEELLQKYHEQEASNAK